VGDKVKEKNESSGCHTAWRNHTI